MKYTLQQAMALTGAEDETMFLDVFGGKTGAEVNEILIEMFGQDGDDMIFAEEIAIFSHELETK